MAVTKICKAPYGRLSATPPARQAHPVTTRHLTAEEILEHFALRPERDMNMRPAHMRSFPSSYYNNSSQRIRSY
jgi:hypothetical protein